MSASAAGTTTEVEDFPGFRDGVTPGGTATDMIDECAFVPVDGGAGA
jgi:hypothetical protein